MDLEAPKSFSNFKLNYIPVHIIGLSGVILHVLLLVAFIKDPLKCFRNSATYLVANLAVSDLIISLCGPYFIWFRHWILHIIMGLTYGVTLVAIVSIAVDRYVMVIYPFKHHYLMSGKKVLIWITSIWTLSSFHAVVEVVLFSFNVYNFFVNVFLAVTIILVTGVLYVLMSIALRRQTRNLVLDDASAGSNRSQVTRFLKETICEDNTIGSVYCIDRYCAILGGFLYTNILIHFLMALCFFTFASNPLIYFLRLPKYRKSFFLLYCRRHSN